MAMMAAGTPIALQAQGNGVTIVVNDGSQTANSISGVVYSEEDNEPLIGVQVRIVGANVATITDVNGKFNFQSVSLKGQKLSFSYVGMETLVVKAGHNMKVVMKNDSKQISDVVVNGYFTRKKQTFTGAAKTITIYHDIADLLRVILHHHLHVMACLDNQGFHSYIREGEFLTQIVCQTS